VIEIARHIRDEAAQSLDGTFDQAYTDGETPKRPDPFAQIAVQTGGTCCTPTASGQACC